MKATDFCVPPTEQKTISVTINNSGYRILLSQLKKMLRIFVYFASRSSHFIMIVSFRAPAENILFLTSLSLILGICFSLTKDRVKLLVLHS